MLWTKLKEIPIKTSWSAGNYEVSNEKQPRTRDKVNIGMRPPPRFMIHSLILLEHTITPPKIPKPGTLMCAVRRAGSVILTVQNKAATIPTCVFTVCMCVVNVLLGVGSVEQGLDSYENK